MTTNESSNYPDLFMKDRTGAPDSPAEPREGRMSGAPPPSRDRLMSGAPPPCRRDRLSVAADPREGMNGPPFSDRLSATTTNVSEEQASRREPPYRERQSAAPNDLAAQWDDRQGPPPGRERLAEWTTGKRSDSPASRTVAPPGCRSEPKEPSGMSSLLKIICSGLRGN